MFLVTIAKAAVVGASLGLAVFGAMNFTFAITASDWLETARKEYLFDYFAMGGGIIGAMTQIVFGAIFRT